MHTHVYPYSKFSGIRFFFFCPDSRIYTQPFLKLEKNGIVVDVIVMVEELFIHENSYLFVIVVAVLHFFNGEKRERRDLREERKREKRKEFFLIIIIFLIIDELDFLLILK